MIIENYAPDVQLLRLSSKWFRVVHNALELGNGTFDPFLWRDTVLEGIELVHQAWPGSEIASWVTDSLAASIGKDATIDEMANACLHVSAQLDVEVLRLENTSDSKVETFLAALFDPSRFDDMRAEKREN